MVRVEKDNAAGEVSNVINDDTSTSAEVLQIVEEDPEEVKEPQVLNNFQKFVYLFYIEIFPIKYKKKIAGDRGEGTEYASGSEDGQIRGINFFGKL